MWYYIVVCEKFLNVNNNDHSVNHGPYIHGLRKLVVRAGKQGITFSVDFIVSLF